MITLKSFIEYVNSIPKDKGGGYSKDQIYLIGLEHKKLPKALRDWSMVAELVGWEGNPESLRAFVKSRMKKEGILEKNVNLLSDRTVEDVNDDTLTNKIYELSKQRQRVRDEWSTYNRIVREESRKETFIDAIKETVGELQALPKVHYKGNVSQDHIKEAILMLGDLHIGVKCDNFMNKYNIEVAIKRVEKLVNDVVEYCHSNNVCQLNIVNLGDMIQGIIHTSARIEQEIDVVSQVMVASEILADALNVLQKAAPKVVYRSVVDNHSRLSPNKDESLESESMSKLIDWYLMERLKDSSIVWQCDNIDDTIGKFDLLNGKKVMFAHGHLDSASQAFQNFIGASREFVDYVLLGHYHNEKLKSYNGLKVYVNGSIVGVEQYALSKRLFGNPSQTLLIFDNNNVVNISIDLTT